MRHRREKANGNRKERETSSEFRSEQGMRKRVSYLDLRYSNKVATYCHVYRADVKEPTQFGSVSGSEIQNLLFSHGGIVSLYRSEPKEPTKFGSVSGSEIQNFCIGRNLV